jgi:uncharacterized protein
MHTVVITGGTGLVGRALTKALLQKGYKVIVMTRQLPPVKQNNNQLQYALWNVEQQTIDRQAIAEADYIIHLAGAGVAEKRWTQKRKQEILSSRVDSSRLITNTVKEVPNKVKAVISASAIGWYGPDPSVPNLSPFKESDSFHNDFLGTTCKAWEDSIEPVVELGKRLVKLRLGIILSKQGGALKEFIKPLRMGVAGILGAGKQISSWIHIDDVVNLFIYAMENEKISGIYNAVALTPVSNRELTLTLAKSRKRFFIPIPVPSFVLKIMLGEMSVEILKSATVSSHKIEETGFSFQYPHIKEAIDNLVQ